MEDQGIIALFFERSEQAIEETDKKYGGYCYSIAYNILSNREGFGGKRQRYISGGVEYDSTPATQLSERFSCQNDPAYFH